MKLADFTPYAKWMSASKALVEPVHRRASSKKDQKKAMLAPEIVSIRAIHSDHLKDQNYRKPTQIPTVSSGY